MSVWNPDNIRDVAESVGISTLHNDVVDNLGRDVEFRISQVLEEALKFMRHGKRTVLSTQDVSNALRILDVEPLYGYESTRPLRFGEASIGPGQPLFYVEDEEVDFEKLINAPLPKVPREMSFTAHWLAIEGVQPSIPQNPTSVDSRTLELLPKGPNVNPNLQALGGYDNVTVKPLVKHILSKELNLFFDKVCTAVVDESNEEFRIAAFASLKEDPGLHQLVPYFVQYVAEKVTHNLDNMFILTQMMNLTESMILNESFHVDPYVAAIVQPVLTCLIGRHVGSRGDLMAQFPLRDVAASLLGKLAQKYSRSTTALKPRLARTCLKNLLDSSKPFGSHYGSLMGLYAIGGSEVVRNLILPNIKSYEIMIKDEIVDDGPRKTEAEKVLGAILKLLASLTDDQAPLMNGHSAEAAEEIKKRLVDVVGDLVGSKIAESGQLQLAKAIIDTPL